jgi:nucleoid DNA-binding protein
MTVTTSSIIAKVHASYEGEVSKTAIRDVVQNFIRHVHDALLSKEIVRLDKIGVFKVKGCAARKGRNPRTGATVKIQARDKVAFKATKSIREGVAKKA